MSDAVIRDLIERLTWNHHLHSFDLSKFKCVNLLSKSKCSHLFMKSKSAHFVDETQMCTFFGANPNVHILLMKPRCAHFLEQIQIWTIFDEIQMGTFFYETKCAHFSDEILMWTIFFSKSKCVHFQTKSIPSMCRRCDSKRRRIL